MVPLALAAIVLVAAAARLPGLDRLPPGLHQDEAVNAWNAYCLLKTGTDQFGVRWPIFYMRELGGNRSVLFLYVLLPFQALGGMNVWTSRLPVALGGILTVLLLYWVGARLFDRATGLTAAAMLAMNPVHIQMSRFGSEPSITPLLTLLPLAALLWAGLPLDDREPRPRRVRALVAGLLAGICCYGYAAVRLFLPLFLAGCVVVTWRGWWTVVRSRRGLLAVGGFLLAIAATFGPLAYEHVAEPEGIGKRGRATWIWSSSDPLSVRAGKVLERYAGHFGPDFLFGRSDADEVVWTAGFGFLPWYTLPLLVGGLAVCVSRLRRSRAARVLLTGVAFYPVGDSLNTHISLQALRSSPGLWLLLLLAALALTRAVGFLLRRRLYAWSLALGIGLAGLITTEGGRFLSSYLSRAGQLAVYHGTHVDLLKACAWLRPRLNDVDTVILTTQDFNQPWVVTLVALKYEPEQWFAGPREFCNSGFWDRWTRYGKLYFLEEAERARLSNEIRARGHPARIIFVLRPGETAPGEPVARIVGPDGKPALLIYDCRL